jgi:hypothetical protein
MNGMLLQTGERELIIKQTGRWSVSHPDTTQIKRETVILRRTLHTEEFHNLDTSLPVIKSRMGDARLN